MLKTLFLAAAVAATFGAAPAFAGDAVQASFPFADTGSESVPGGSVEATVPVTAGGVLPSEGGETIVQSANSLPVGFADGTAAEQDARIADRYFAGQVAREARVHVAAR